MAMRRLILMRHAKALWPEEMIDHARPLAQRGKDTAPIMARWLKAHYPVPDYVIVSSARRTQETFDLVCAEIPGLAASSVTDPHVYEAAMHDVLDSIAETSSRVTTLMLIGHNPGIQDVAEMLANPATSDTNALNRLKRKYPTASLAVLEFEGDWEGIDTPRIARLVRFITPAMLGGVDED